MVFCLLLAYRYTNDLCILICTFINSNSLSLDYIDYFMHTTTLSVNQSIFGTSFLILIPFISLPCLTTLARISFTKLNRIDETDIFGFFFFLIFWPQRESLLCFTIKYDICSFFLIVLNHKQIPNIIKWFSASIMMTTWFSSLIY